MVINVHRLLRSALRGEAPDLVTEGFSSVCPLENNGGEPSRDHSGHSGGSACRRSLLAAFTACWGYCLFPFPRPKKTVRLNRALDAPAAYRLYRLSIPLYSNAQAPQFWRCLPTSKMARCQRMRERGPLCCAGLGAFHDSIPREGCPST